ncbi:MAG: glycosyltransferase family 2 protein [Gemmatimonadaceae bacterium]|nr:glycosyltransferase family 2 protein [Gemmatimonadaceae bacterium]
MATSLVITTYRRPDALSLVLSSVAAQTTLPCEVVVADDGSGPETLAVVDHHRALLAERGVSLIHAWHPDDGFRASAIRNCAIRRSCGDYLIFVDGDCVLHGDFVRSHEQYARDGCFVQGGRVLLDKRHTAEALRAGVVAPGVWRAGVRNRLSGLSLPWLAPLVPSPRDPLRGVRSANLAVWRDDVERVNGFDERYVGWGREDSDFVARLVMAGRRRRKLKFGGIVHHLWHPERPRGDLDRNHASFEQTLYTGAWRCEYGMAEHRCSARSEATATT